MHARRPLDPETRTLYGESLRPPDGYAFDAGVATTFSLDFDTVLAVPVSLSLFAAEDRDSLLTQPLVLLEGAERIADRLVIFAEAGRILAHEKRHSRLCALLERVVVEVVAPRGGAFHPKLWALRFTPLDSNGPVRVRLIVLTRNLTGDRSWDIALSLDGEVTGRPIATNRELGELLAAVPHWTLQPLPPSAATLVAGIAGDVRKTHWTVPAPFTDLTFAVTGVRGTPWFPAAARRLGVVSPFCDDATLRELANRSTEAKPVFIGRGDELAAIPPQTLARYARVAVLDDRALTDDTDERSTSALQGLHAKIYVAEHGRYTSVTVGSGNATAPALLRGSNVEVYATLTGTTGKVGSVDDLLGPAGFGRIARDYVAGETPPVDVATRADERDLDGARRSLCLARLRLRCESVAATDTLERHWRLWLVPCAPLALPALSAVHAWPITLGGNHGVDVLTALGRGEGVALGTLALADLGAFVAFRLTHTTGATLTFGTGLAIAGLPDDRNGAIFRSVIANRGAFLRYLMLLLSETGDAFGAALAAQRGVGAGSGRAADDEPLLESLVKALGRGERRQIDAVDRLMQRLEQTDDVSADPIPAGFRELWLAFREATQTLERTHDD